MRRGLELFEQLRYRHALAAAGWHATDPEVGDELGLTFSGDVFVS